MMCLGNSDLARRAPVTLGGVKRLGWIAFVVGCGFQGTAPSNTPADGNGSTPVVDASVPSDDGPPPPPPPDAMPPCFTTGLLGKLCLAAVPTVDVTLSNAINTDNAATCTQTLPQGAGAPSLCLIAGKTIAVQGTVNVTGNRALVLVAAETLTVAAGATLDASSRTTNPQRKGAAANTGGCNNPSPPENGASGAGAAGGGSFATKGSNGGDGTGGGNPARGGNAGNTVAIPSLLRGGCPGGKGGASAILPVIGGNGG